MIEPHWAVKIRSEKNPLLVFYAASYNDEDPVLYSKDDNLNNNICKSILPLTGICDCDEYEHFMPLITKLTVQADKVTIKFAFIKDAFKDDWGSDGVDFFVEDALEKDDLPIGTIIIPDLLDITVNPYYLTPILELNILEATPDILEKYSLTPRFRLIGKDKKGKFKVLRYINSRDDLRKYQY